MNGTILITRHAFSCANLKKLKGDSFGQATEPDPSLTLWGILLTLIQSDNIPAEPVTTISSSSPVKHIYVSCLIRTWETAVLLYGPSHAHLRLIISPYVKEEGITNDNLPKPIDQQIQKLRQFLEYLHLIRTFNKIPQFGGQHLALQQLQKMNQLTIDIYITMSLVETITYDFTTEINVNNKSRGNTLVNNDARRSSVTEMNRGRSSTLSEVANRARRSFTSALIGQRIPTDNLPQRERHGYGDPLNETNQAFLKSVIREFNLTDLDETALQNFPSNNILTQIDYIRQVLDMVLTAGVNNPNQYCYELERNAHLLNAEHVELNAMRENSPELRQSYLEKFIGWLIHYNPFSNDVNCVFHSHVMQTFVEDFFTYHGNSKIIEDLGLKSQNTWSIELGVEGGKIISGKIITGRCQPKKNVHHLISSCEQACDFGRDYYDQNDKCYSKVYDAVNNNMVYQPETCLANIDPAMTSTCSSSRSSSPTSSTTSAGHKRKSTKRQHHHRRNMKKSYKRKSSKQRRRVR